MTDSLLFQIQMSEQKWWKTSQQTFLHIIISSWQLTVSMHQIGGYAVRTHYVVVL